MTQVIMNLPTMNMLLRKFDLWQKRRNELCPSTFFIIRNILQNWAGNKHFKCFLKLLGKITLLIFIHHILLENAKV